MTSLGFFNSLNRVPNLVRVTLVQTMRNIIATCSIILAANALCAQTRFTDFTQTAGIDHNYVGYEYGGGVACGDFNGDGFLDLYVPNGRGKGDFLFLNNGDATFTEVGKAARVADEDLSIGVVAGDVDNDGDLDLYVTNFAAPNRLYLNNGTGVFRDFAVPAGVADNGPGSSAAMVDYDNDGDLDIYVLNRSSRHSSILYRNNGNGSFTNVTAAAGVGVSGRWLEAAFFDYDLDGDQDLFLVEEFEMDQFFANNGDGTFTDITASTISRETDGMGIDFADYDSDGDFDFYIGDYYNDPLFRNDNGVFQDVSTESGIENLGVGWGVNFMDFDNDGDKDVYVINGAMLDSKLDRPNAFFVNDGNGKFTEKAAEFGLDIVGDGRGSVSADFNRDGYLDIFFVCVLRGKSALFLNKGGSNNWITLKLEGVLSNRSAVGARVEVTAGGVTQIDEVRAGSSYASMHPLELEFGLERGQIVDKIVVHWPSGTVQTLENVAINQLLKITEPAETTSIGENISLLPKEFSVSQNFPNPFNPSTEIRYSLPQQSRVALKISDISGRIIRQIDRGVERAGEHTIVWHSNANDGSRVASGVYFYQIFIQTENSRQASEPQKMLLLK